MAGLPAPASTWNTPSGCSSRTHGWTARRSARPAAGDRWTWLIIAAHTQLPLARPLVADLRRDPGKPAWTRRPAHPSEGPPWVLEHPRRPCSPPAPKPSPDPGRPPGSRNRTPRDQPRRETRTDCNRTTPARRLEIKLSLGRFQLHMTRPPVALTPMKNEKVTRRPLPVTGSTECMFLVQNRTASPA